MRSVETFRQVAPQKINEGKADHDSERDGECGTGNSDQLFKAEA